MILSIYYPQNLRCKRCLSFVRCWHNGCYRCGHCGASGFWRGGSL